MYVRNCKGEIVEFHPEKYPTTTLLYQALWQLKYGIVLERPHAMTARKLAAFAQHGTFR